jgi:hypothetical protein
MSADRPDDSRGPALTPEQFQRFAELTLEPKASLTPEERRELASLVRRLLARARLNPPE